MTPMTRAAFVTGLAGTACTASAALPAVLLEITATNDQGTATWQLTLSDGITDPQQRAFLFNLGGQQFQMFDNEGDLIATVISPVGQFGGNPFDPSDPSQLAQFAFTFVSGDSDTMFEIDTSLLNFPTINGASAQATATYTVTDSNNDGAFLTGGLANGALIEDYYNGEATGGGSFFTSHFQGLNATTGLGGSDADNTPTFGPQFVGDVSSIDVRSKFTLSANDQGSINTNFFVVPTPATLALFGISAAAFTRRQR